MKEEEILTLVKKLKKEQKIQFGITCIERVIDLYKYFDETQDISLANPSLKKGEGYKALYSILNFIKAHPKSCKESEVEKQIELCEPLIADNEIYDTGTEVTIAEIIAQAVTYLLEFYLDSDAELIYECSQSILELLNQIKSEEYTEKVNPKADDKELERHLKPIYEQELQIEKEIITLIKNETDKEILDKFVQENKIK